MDLLSLPPSPFHLHPSTFTLSEQCSLPRRLFQPLSLVEETLHELLFLVAVRKDFADGLGHEPQRRIVGVTALPEELRHPLRVALFSKGAQAVQHVNQAGRCTIGGRLTEFFTLIRLEIGTAWTFSPDFSSTPVRSHISSVCIPSA
jgi:hypothetical protein